MDSISDALGPLGESVAPTKRSGGLGGKMKLGQKWLRFVSNGRHGHLEAGFEIWTSLDMCREGLSITVPYCCHILQGESLSGVERKTIARGSYIMWFMSLEQFERMEGAIREVNGLRIAEDENPRVFWVRLV